TALATTNALLEWGLVSLLTWHILPAEPGLFEFGVATGTYPLLAPILTHLHRGPAAPERA
ncbi:hypothetical protein ACR4XK_12225, partial [Glaesserella parasuis]|uniref:hypothetical protein n=1 Tax=Glaesserella parasuis TaxID=738 RepID=UPI003F348068